MWHKTSPWSDLSLYPISQEYKSICLRMSATWKMGLYMSWPKNGLKQIHSINTAIKNFILKKQLPFTVVLPYPYQPHLTCLCLRCFIIWTFFFYRGVHFASKVHTGKLYEHTLLLRFSFQPVGTPALKWKGPRSSWPCSVAESFEAFPLPLFQKVLVWG